MASAKPVKALETNPFCRGERRKQEGNEDKKEGGRRKVGIVWEGKAEMESCKKSDFALSLVHSVSKLRNRP